MKKNALLLISLLIFSIGFAQRNSIFAPMKPISQTEVNMTEYEKDMDAEAVVLYDYGDTYFSPSNEGFEIVFEKTTRIKILKESGIDWSEIEIPFYSESGSEEKITEIKGITYNFENGNPETTHLDEKQTYVEVHNKYWSSLKVPMPNVQVGSIIELHYKSVTKSIYHLHDWEFQWDIPVIHSEYQVSLTPFYNYKWILQGANKFHSKKSEKSTGLEKSIFGINYKDMTHNYVMKDIPAFKDADFITTREDYIIKMDWQLIKYTTLRGIEHEVMSSWEKIKKEYEKADYFGKFISKTNKKAGKLIDIPKIGNSSDREKVEQVLNYVKGNYKYNNIQSKSASVSFNTFISKKEGLSGEINLFTIGLLNAVGMEAYGVIISTRKHGRIYYDYPFTHFFNYVLIYAKVDDEFVLLDATDPNISNWSIPSKCINGKGLLIQEGDVKWIPIHTNTNSEKTIELNISIDDEEIFSQIELTYKGYFASDMRAEINDESFNAIEDIMEDEGVIEESVEMQNLDNPEEALVLKFDYIKESPLGHDKIYFSPFQKEVLSENPLKEKDREYPIDFTYSRKYSYKSSIKIPEGYEVEYSKNGYSHINNDFVQISYTSKEENGLIIIDFSYWFKKAKYPSATYGRLKYYFNEVVKLGQEKVVFKKI